MYIIIIMSCGFSPAEDYFCQTIELPNDDDQVNTYKIYDYSLSSIELTKQVSTSECVLGTGYGTTGKTAWVDEGCRGEFKVCYCTCM